MRPELTCAQCRELIPRYRAGQLPDAQRDAVARHVAGCDECRRELAFWSAVGDALAASDASQPIPVDQARVWSGVRAALASQRGGLAHQNRERGNRTNTQTPTPPTTPPPSRVAGMPPAPSRRRPIAAAFAFALIVVLSVALFGVVAPRLRHSTPQIGHGPHATATPAACPPSQLRQSLPANASLSAISMVSARDGWAVGQILDLSHPATAPQGLIMHFQSCEWRQAEIIPAAALTAVAMASPADGWAVGTTMTSVNSGAGISWVDDRGLLLHYHNGVWQPVTYPDSHVPADYEEIHMASATDGWMLIYNGKVHITPYTTAENYALYHYDGTAWRAVSMPFKTPDMSIGGMAAGADDLWLTGYDVADYNSGTIARYHDGQWQTWNSTSNELYVVAFASPENVWAYGTHTAHDASGDHFSEVVLHYDGATWSQVPSAKETPSMLGPTTATELANGDVWSFEHTAGAISGPSGPGTIAASTIAIHCAATGCQANPLVLPGGESTDALSLFSSTQGFAIEGHGIFDEVPTGLLYFDDGQWSIIPAAG